MQGLNRVTLIGRLGADPEQRITDTGSKMSRFSIATNIGSGDSSRTDWHRIVAFGRTAELCQEYLNKGQLCCVEGRISYYNYKKNNEPRSITEIVAQRVHFLSSRRQIAGDEMHEMEAFSAPSSDDARIPF